LIINKSGSANGRSQERRAKLCLRTNTYTHSFSQLIVFWRFIALCEYKWNGRRRASLLSVEFQKGARPTHPLAAMFGHNILQRARRTGENKAI
jgi:hypothetical protein